MSLKFFYDQLEARGSKLVQKWRRFSKFQIFFLLRATSIFENRIISLTVRPILYYKNLKNLEMSYWAILIGIHFSILKLKNLVYTNQFIMLVKFSLEEKLKIFKLHITITQFCSKYSKDNLRKMDAK